MTHDLVIVGGGPGGYTAALTAAQRGASVALVEREHLGGVCLNWGCIPTKALLASSKLCEQMRHAGEVGVSCGEVTPDFPAIAARKDKVVATLRTALSKLMAARKIEVVEGSACLESAGEVRVEGPDGPRVLAAPAVIIATGAGIAPLPGLDVDGRRVLDIKQALNLDWLPARLVVVGAGVVGCEMAQHFSGLGSAVELVEILDRPLGGMLDAEIEKLVLRGFKKRRYKLHMGDRVESVTSDGEGVTVSLASGQDIQADAVLVAVGMKPHTAGLGLEALGVATKPSGHIVVDQHARTNVPGVYAVGDVTGIAPLAHFAAHMGAAAARHALGDASATVHPEAVPKAVFIEPELAWVGLTEAEAAQRHGAVVCGRFLVRGLGRATAENRLDGMIKLVARADSHALLGAHIMGHQADALIAEATLALGKGLTLEDLAATIHAHPTYAEGLLEAAEAGLAAGPAA